MTNMMGHLGMLLSLPESGTVILTVRGTFLKPLPGLPALLPGRLYRVLRGLGCDGGRG